VKFTSNINGYMELIVGVRGIHGLLILTHCMSLVLISTNYAAEKNK